MEQYFQDIDDGAEGKTYSSSLFLQLCELIYAFAPLFKSFFLNHFNISYRVQLLLSTKNVLPYAFEFLQYKIASTNCEASVIF